MALAQSAPGVLTADIPVQPLARALDALARQTGLQIIYVSADVGARASGAARRGMSAHEALSGLLVGTGLQVQFLTPVSVRILAPAAPRPSTAAQAASVVPLAASDEILITARHANEPVWSVPLSMALITGDDLRRSGIQNLDDLALAVPGLAAVYRRGAGQVPVIRGMASTTQLGKNSVATLYGGVYIANAFTVDMNLLDIEQIEVLRGPQNPLVGRDAFAGALLYQPARPTDQPLARGLAELGSDGFMQAAAIASGPLRENITGRLAVSWLGFDGTIPNRAAPQHNLGGNREFALSATLQWQSKGALSAMLSGLWFETQRDATARFALTSQKFNCGRDATGSFVNYCGEFPAPRTLDISPDAQGLNTQTALARLELSWHWSRATLESLTGYVNSHSDNAPDDWDLSSAGEPVPVAKASAPDEVIRLQRANIYYGGSPIDDDELSEQLQLSGHTARLQWLIGAYGARNQSRNHEAYATDARGLAPDEVFSGPYNGTLTPLETIPAYENSVRSTFYSGYGSLAYAASGPLGASAQLRWSREQDVDLTAGNQRAAWSIWTPRFTVSYRVAPQTQAYLSAARGARSGGFNDLSISSESQFGPEINWTYEAGIKAGSSRRVQATAAVYYVDWSNLQVTSPANSPNNPQLIVRNAGSALVRGAEFAIEADPAHWVHFAVAYAYANARMRAGSTDLGLAHACTPEICQMVPVPGWPDLVPDVSGKQLPNAPRNAASLSAIFHGIAWQRGQWSWEIGVDLLSREYTDTTNLNWIASRHVWNTRLGLSTPRWEAALWGRNLTPHSYDSFSNFEGTDVQYVIDRMNSGYVGATVLYRLN